MALAFHESFTLSRPALSQLLGALEGNRLKAEALATQTSLGTNYQKAMPRYAYRAGLLDERRCLTAFGRHVVQADPYLEQLATQWLLHYHLAAPHGPTAFWHMLVCRYFRPGNTLTAEALTEALTAFVAQPAGKPPAARTIRSTVTVFLGSYLKPDGLGRLGLLEARDGDYRVGWPDPPPLWAFAYALADYWQAHYGHQLTANLEDLVNGDFAAVFLLGESSATELLMMLKREGMVDVYRTAHPYQVVLLQPNPEDALRRLYEI